MLTLVRRRPRITPVSWKSRFSAGAFIALAERAGTAR